jgi:hypothetical protein
VNLDVKEIPRGNIMARWTKTQGDHGFQSGGSKYDCATNDTTAYVKKRQLIKRMLEVTNQTNGITDEAFADAMEAIESMVPKSETPQPKEHATMKGSGHSCSSMKCPPRPTKKGRPPNTSLRSWKQEQKRKQKESTDEENPTGAKTRPVNEVMGL